MFPHNRLLEPILFPKKLEEAWAESEAETRGIGIFERFLDRLGVHWMCPAEDLAHVPRKGPVVVVANHPFGMVEGAVMGALLARMRPDVRFLANSLLGGIPGLEEFVIPVDPFGGAAQDNWRFVRQSVRWLRKGGVLVTFPAGEVASLRLPKLEIADPEWNETIGGLIRLSGSPTIPIYFYGSNGPAFHIAGLVHPRMRTALLPLELLNKKGVTIRVSVGRVISAETLTHLPTDRQRVDYLRTRTLLLEERHRQAPPLWKFELPKPAVVPPIAAQTLRAEVEKLNANRLLAESGEIQVWIAKSAEIPNVLREIGRLRELTFRKVGEGTGRSLDIDRFDAHYRHLWLWNKATSEVCGAYRLTGTDEIPESSKPDTKLYTGTLFKFRPGLIQSLHPALELGRSFVRPEYQRSYQALLLLWKGIGAWVARNPRYRILFGPVSISREYAEASRALMVSYFEHHLTDPQLAGAATPRKEFRVRPLRSCDLRTLTPLLSGIDELSDAVADVERDGKGLPVLLRQYLNLGGAMVAFNVDNAFSGVVDGLVIVDLCRLSPRLLTKYLGAEGAERFTKEQSLRKNASSN
jgi:putative hemolysin